MQISKRLEAVAGMVTSGHLVADIGTDHAYIPIYLVKNQKNKRVLAMDVNKGPLQKAREHIALYGLSDCIDTRLSDGLAALAPDEAESVIIAGMGGPLTVRILTEGKSRLGACRELILQPQSEIRAVRAYLETEGWKIVQENMILEDGKYYPMMRAVKCGVAAGTAGQDPAGCDTGKMQDTESVQLSECGSLPGVQMPMTEVELRYGRFLLREKNPVLEKFLLHEQELNRRILASLAEQTGEGAVARRSEVERDLQIIEEALKRFA